tara:strand:- start:121 stop:441 length:321 start_codon:yes stop_codon:yes gene_type:complete
MTKHTRQQETNLQLFCFFTGLGLGILGTYLVFKKPQEIGLKTLHVFKNDRKVLVSYHYNKNSNKIIFKDYLEKVDITVILNDQKEIELLNFSGIEVQLHNLTGINN